MNLPVILDIAIVLLITYLILSLVASEIQEIIATILQWRAKHLKESIENLLAGPSEEVEQVEATHEQVEVEQVQNFPQDGTQEKVEQVQVRNLVKELYDDPLIKNVNQEAKGTIANLPRKLGRGYAESIFGKNKSSGPSYLNSETFATSLMEKLEISTLNQNLGKSRLEEFKSNLFNKIEHQLVVKFYPKVDEDTQVSLTEELDQLRLNLNEITNDFINNQEPVENTIDRIEEKINMYVENSKNFLPEEAASHFYSQIKTLMQDFFGGENSKKVLLGKLKPSLNEIANEIKNNKAIPKTIGESLAILARRAQARISRGEEDINQLRQEIEAWFDRSMERSIGVYKRNAKLVAFLLGFLIAVISNTDTFHIVSRASQDEVLRSTVGSYAQAQVSNCQDLLPPLRENQATPEQQRAFRDCLKTGIVQDLSEQISLPIGWSGVNLEQQGLSFNSVENPQQEIPRWLGRFVLTFCGWVLSALAISMGAPFWFDLLSKVMHVRNTGTRETSATQQPSSVAEDGHE